MTFWTPGVGLVIGMAASEKHHTMPVVLGAFIGLAVGMIVMLAIGRAIDRLVEQHKPFSEFPTFVQRLALWTVIVLLLIGPVISGVCAHFAVVAFG
jgi:hypothetical protein